MLTQDQVDAIWELFEQGKSTREISRELKISRGTVSNFTRLGKTTPTPAWPRNGNAKNEDTNCWVPTPEEIEERLKPLRRFREIGLAGLDLNTAISDYLERNGVKTARKKYRGKTEK